MPNLKTSLIFYSVFFMIWFSIDARAQEANYTGTFEQVINNNNFLLFSNTKNDEDVSHLDKVAAAKDLPQLIKKKTISVDINNKTLSGDINNNHPSKVFELKSSKTYRNFLFSHFAFKGSAAHKVSFDLIFDAAHPKDLKFVLGAQPKNIDVGSNSPNGISSGTEDTDIVEVSFKFNGGIAPANDGNLEILVNGVVKSEAVLSKGLIRASKQEAVIDGKPQNANQIYVKVPVTINMILGTVAVTVGTGVDSVEATLGLTSDVLTHGVKQNLSYGFTQSKELDSNSVMISNLSLTSVDKLSVDSEGTQDKKVFDAYFISNKSAATSSSGEELEAYWKPTYTRGVGTIPTHCGAGKVNQAGLCYDKMPDDMHCAGVICGEVCPSGYTDTGVRCEKTYGNGVGTVMQSNCPSGKYNDAGLCYSPCAAGYYNVGPVCWANNKPWHFVFHAWDYSYGRGVGTIPLLSCPAGLNEIAGLCYQPCSEGFYPVGGNICSASFTKRIDTRSVGIIPAFCESGKVYDAGLCYTDIKKDKYSCHGPICWKACKEGYVDAGARCATSLGDAIAGSAGDNFQDLIENTDLNGASVEEVFSTIGKGLKTTMTALSPQALITGGLADLVDTKFPRETLTNYGMSEEEANTFMSAYSYAQVAVPLLVKYYTRGLDTGANMSPLLNYTAQAVDIVNTGFSVSKIFESDMPKMLTKAIDGDADSFVETFANAAKLVILDYLVDGFSSLELGQNINNDNSHQFASPTLDRLNEYLQPLGQRVEFNAITVANPKMMKKENVADVKSTPKELVTSKDVFSSVAEYLKSNPDKFKKVRSAGAGDLELAKVLDKTQELLNIEDVLSGNEEYENFKNVIWFLSSSDESLCQSRSKTYNVTSIKYDSNSKCKIDIGKVKENYVKRFASYFLESDELTGSQLDTLLDVFRDLSSSDLAVNVIKMKQGLMGERFSAFVSNNNESRIVISEELWDSAQYRDNNKDLVVKLDDIVSDHLASNYIEEYGHLVEWAYRNKLNSKNVKKTVEAPGDEGSRFRFAITQAKSAKDFNKNLPKAWVEDSLLVQNSKENSNGVVSIESFGTMGMISEVINGHLGTYSGFALNLDLVGLSIPGIGTKNGTVGVASGFKAKITYFPARISKTKYYYQNPTDETEKTYFYNQAGQIRFNIVEDLSLSISGSSSKVSAAAYPLYLSKVSGVIWNYFLDDKSIARLTPDGSYYFVAQDVGAGVYASINDGIDAVRKKFKSIKGVNNAALKFFTSTNDLTAMVGATYIHQWSLKDKDKVKKIAILDHLPGAVAFTLAEVGLHVASRGKLLKRSPLTGIGQLAHLGTSGAAINGASELDKNLRPDNTSYTTWTTANTQLPSLGNLLNLSKSKNGYLSITEAQKNKLKARQNELRYEMTQINEQAEPKKFAKVKKAKQGPSLISISALKSDLMWYLVFNGDWQSNRNSNENSLTSVLNNSQGQPIVWKDERPSRFVGAFNTPNHGYDTFQVCITDKFKNYTGAKNKVSPDHGLTLEDYGECFGPGRAIPLFTAVPAFGTSNNWYNKYTNDPLRVFGFSGEQATSGKQGYEALVSNCNQLKQEGKWGYSCDVPAVDSNMALQFFNPVGQCGCDGAILKHKASGLYRCEKHKASCGGVSFKKTLGYSPNLNWYEVQGLTNSSQQGYKNLVDNCKTHKSAGLWKYSCGVPAVDKDAAKVFFKKDDNCQCEGRVLKHKVSGLYRCETHKSSCGGVSFMDSLGYPPNLDYYNEVYSTD